MNDKLIQILNKRPLIIDGAMGTVLEAKGRVGSCNEELCLTRPDILTEIHREYLEAGADIITTNSFGALRSGLANHGLGDKAFQINRAAADIARAAADMASSPGQPCFVAGDIGPGSKLPTLGHIGFAEMFDAYVEQMEALIEGGVDLFLIETCQDPLQMKAALAATKEATARTNRELPAIISATMEKTGAMLLGTELVAALAAVAPYGPFAFGINCATGPESMEEHLQVLADTSPFPIICQPNAGMPENVDGKPRYLLGPQAFAEALTKFTKRFGIAFVGGCCGTTPEHIKVLAREIKGKEVKHKPRLMQRKTSWVSSLYTAQDLKQEPRPFIVAEQTNVNGSKKFRDLLLAGEFDAMAQVAKNAAGASHALDICLAYVGRDEVKDFADLLRRVILKADAAVMIDSTKPEVIEASLAVIPGRAIINSINLEDSGTRARRIFALARRFGAAVVALSIDERGMAKTAADKLAIAKRIANLAESEGIPINALLFDPLTFTLASGDPLLRNAGTETLEGIRVIKQNIPSARTILGISNISFGLSPKGRKMLTSVFLHMALEVGLDAAIINPQRILPMDAISQEDVFLCQHLILNDTSRGDPLASLLERLNDDTAKKTKIAAKAKATTPADELKEHIIAGNISGLPSIIENTLDEMEAAEIVNEILLPAMREMGIRFGSGFLPLPFVLQSAEAMRAAVDLLSPHMAVNEASRKGTIVLATVRGDVHDIGKNLVDIILSNNGFRVVNLGIRQPAAAIIEAVAAENAKAIGLSGLLVSSTEVMREDLEVFRDAGLSLPVLCGGAALTPSFVKEILGPTYGSHVYYCRDAFAGLQAMEEIVNQGPDLYLKNL